MVRSAKNLIATSVVLQKERLWFYAGTAAAAGSATPS
jgi:hypothetical protein